jgi:serine/threonine-protein kinase
MNRLGPIQLFAEIKRRDDRATYRGFDAESGQIVLVKIFMPMLLPDETTLARFHQEAAIYASLKHPNVVKLVKFGVEQSRPYLALEFIEGQNLRALLAQRRPLPNDIALWIALALLAGLAEIHRLGIIHRDLKPENIMIGHDGSVKICDFDLAIGVGKRQVASNKGTTDNWQLTTDHLLFGSPGYFSPEAILGESFTARSDIFALGVIFYELFAGARPFAAPTASGEMNAVIRLPHLPLAKFNNTIPPEIEQLINRMLAKSPPERPRDAAEILKQISAHFQIPAAERRAQTLQRYLNDPSSYQSEELVLAATTEVKPKFHRSKIVGRTLAAAALLGLAIVLSYQWFSPSITESNEHELSTPATTATSRSGADSISPMAERISVLDDLPPRPEGFLVEEVKKIPVPGGQAEAKASAQPLVKNIVVRNFPWAYLFVSGDSIGQMPRAEPLTLNAGAYQFEFKKPLFPPILFNVVVDSTTADTLLFSLLERVAQVEVKVHPWAEIYVDGARREISTAAPVLYLLPGEHHFKFVHSQYGEKNETLFLRAGEMRRLEVNMFQGAKLK